MRTNYFFTVCTICLIIHASMVKATTRGLSVKVDITQDKSIELYTNSHALVIGNGNYTNGWDLLPGAIQDSKDVAQALEKNGFNVILKTNLTKDAFNRAFGEFVERFGMEKNSRLLFYYAGHGYTRKMVNGGELGYIVMVDSPLPEKHRVNFSIKSVNMEYIITQAKIMRARHVLFMFDSCFSGTILNFRDRVVPKSISNNIKYPVRQFITAGRGDETVPDKSVFKQVFINLLEGREEEPIPDGYITGEELGLFLKNKVPEYNSFQHPQYGKIKDPGLDQGDFVFILGQDKSKEESVNLKKKELEKELKSIEAQVKKAEEHAEELEEKERIAALQKKINEAKIRKREAENKVIKIKEQMRIARVDPQEKKAFRHTSGYDKTKKLTIIDARGTAIKSIKKRGYIMAGVNGRRSGFSMKDKYGVWRGIDVDTARALAAAVFGDASKVKFTPLTAKTRFTALQSGEIDVLTRNCTQTLGRDTALGLDFCQVNYYDGQGFLVSKNLGVSRAKQLDGAAVCVLPGTTTELNVADYFRANGLKMRPVVIENTAELVKAFFAGRCDVLTSDATMLAAQRSTAPNPYDYLILPEIISQEPFAPVVRHGDDQWYDIVNFTLMALINAEEMDITSTNIDQMIESKDFKIRRFLGVNQGMGKGLGLDDKWAYNIIKQVGNYGEIFERNVGVNTPLGLERGLNALWTKGGLMYAVPFR
jgi:general L-amino acid transport system substrate-binding protein